MHEPNAPLVSVIVPVYNVERYLPACVASIRGQSYPRLEILLIDDGSTDGCPALCDGYAAADPRIRVLHQKNAGLAGARNAGLDRSTGAYLTFVDSDDLLRADCIAQLLHACRAAQAPAAIGDFVRVPEEGPAAQALRPGPGAPVRCITGREANLLLYELPSWTRMTTAWGKLFHRSLFAQQRFPAVRLHEDEALICRLLYPLPRIALCDAPLYGYRSRSGSLMGRPLSEEQLGIFPILEERARFYAAQQEPVLVQKTCQRAFAIATRFYCAARRAAPGSPLADALRAQQKRTYSALLRCRPSPLHTLKYTLLRFVPGLAQVLLR